jgi:hypothetical protein
MQLQNDKTPVRDENSLGRFLSELGFDIVGELMPDSLIGCIVVILAAVLVGVGRSFPDQ